MSPIYTFENDSGKKIIIHDNITWGGNLEWNLVEKDNNIKNCAGEMPYDRWCYVKSYQFKLFGIWKLV